MRLVAILLAALVGCGRATTLSPTISRDDRRPGRRSGLEARGARPAGDAPSRLRSRRSSRLRSRRWCPSRPSSVPDGSFPSPTIAPTTSRDSGGGAFLEGVGAGARDFVNARSTLELCGPARSSSCSCVACAAGSPEGVPRLRRRGGGPRSAAADDRGEPRATRARAATAAARVLVSDDAGVAADRARREPDAEEAAAAGKAKANLTYHTGSTRAQTARLQGHKAKKIWSWRPSGVSRAGAMDVCM